MLSSCRQMTRGFKPDLLQTAKYLSLQRYSFAVKWEISTQLPKEKVGPKNKYDYVKLKFGDEARDALKTGIIEMANAVAATYGPKGSNVLLDDNDVPVITKDGVTVAKHVGVNVRNQNIGCRLLKKIAGSTNEIAGDGTTTSTVLAGELVKYLLHKLGIQSNGH